MEPADPNDPAFRRLDCPIAEASDILHWKDIRSEYQERQRSYSKGLRKVEINGERAFHGHEGEMLYVRFPDGTHTKPSAFTRLIKLKPEEIEEIHQALDHVPREEIEATARNVWEISDEPQLEDLVTLLSEDWYPEQIRKSMETVERVLEECIEKHRYEDNVLEIFQQNSSPTEFRNNPPQAMRSLQGKFPRTAMGRIFGILDTRLPTKESLS